MIQLKKMTLENFCGYKKPFEIDFTDGDNIKRWTMLYGPNGIGKSNFLEAVRLLTYPTVIRGRPDLELFFKRLTYDKDYQVGYEKFNTNKNNLKMHAVFSTSDGDKEIEIKHDWTKKGSGLIKDDLKTTESLSFYLDADNPMNMHRFQLKSEYKESFLDFANAVYGLRCEIPESDNVIVKEYNSTTGKKTEFYTDFVIIKYDGTRVHFKKMSDGERKIATMLRTLFHRLKGSEQDTDRVKPHILLIDNVELHVYWKRHMVLLQKLEEHFPNCQIIATTHSPIIINELDQKYLLDLEKYMGAEHYGPNR